MTAQLHVTATFSPDVPLQVWTRKEPSTIPGARYGAKMCYFPGLGVIMLGGTLDGTNGITGAGAPAGRTAMWVWDGSNWTNWSATTGQYPFNGFGGALVYHEKEGKAVWNPAFDGAYRTDWAEFDGTDWREFSGAGAMPNGVWNGGAYDPLVEKVYVQNGFNNPGTYEYSFSAHTWSLVSNALAGYGGAVFFDGIGIIHANGSAYGFGTTRRFVTGTWSNGLVAANPGFNDGLYQGAIWHPKLEVGILKADYETWQWDATTLSWSQMFPAGNQPTTASHRPLAYDEENGTLVTFGGNAAPTSGTWLLEATGSAPSATTYIANMTASWSTGDTDLLIVQNDGAYKGRVTPTTGSRIYGGRAFVTASMSSSYGNMITDIMPVIIVPTDSGTFPDYPTQPVNFPHMPMSATHWTALGLSPWGAYGGLQEATGSVVLSGSAGYTLTPTAAATTGDGNPIRYQQTVPGWQRKAIMIMTGSGNRLGAGPGTGPNPSTTSTAFLVYAKPEIESNVDTGLVGFFGSVASNRVMIRKRTASTLADFDLQVANSADRQITGPIRPLYGDRVHPFMVVYNRTTAEAWAFTDIGVMWTGSVPAIADDDKGIGSENVACSASFLYYATCTGSIAEWLSNPSNAGSFLNSMGWNCLWSSCPTDSGSIKLPFLYHHWTEVGWPEWQATHNCQETAGNLQSTDVIEGINSIGWQLTANGTPEYDKPIADWTRRSVGFNQTLNQRFNASISSLTTARPTQHAYLAYAEFLTEGANARAVFGQCATANNSRFFCVHNTDGTLGVNVSGTVTNGAADHRTGRVHPVLIVYDEDNSRAKLYTDLEKVTASFLPGVAGQGGNVGLGAIASGLTSFSGSILYFATATGSVAGTLSDDGQASKFLKDLGWSLTW